MILVDLQKAFDTLDHTVPLQKMECVGFKGELHSNSWNLTFVNKLQFPLILRSFDF